jgi:hypothetical protein
MQAPLSHKDAHDTVAAMANRKRQENRQTTGMAALFRKTPQQENTQMSYNVDFITIYVDITTCRYSTLFIIIFYSFPYKLYFVA